MQYFLHTNLVPMYPSVYVSQSLGMLCIYEGICKDLLSIFLAVFKFVLSSKLPDFHLVAFPVVWDYVEVGLDSGMQILLFMVFIKNLIALLKDCNCAVILRA